MTLRRWRPAAGAFGVAALFAAVVAPGASPPVVTNVTAVQTAGTVLEGMVLIPAGPFQMGDTFGEGDSDELPVHPVYVDAFHIDRTEVTNQAYADGLNWAYGQGGHITVTSGVVYKYPNDTSCPYCDTNSYNVYSCIVWDGSTFTVESGRADQPVVQVTWYGSAAYANWRSAMEGKPLCYDLSSWQCNWGSGYRLPTEAEWEKAARGGVAGYRFPWSDSNYIQHARANYDSSSSYAYDTSPTRGYHPDFDDGGYPYTSPVGYFAPNGYGLYDMVGNVWEWCNDWYSSSYYDDSPYNSPRGPTSETYRVLRGGSWAFSAYDSRVARRWGYALPGSRGGRSGFRLALGGESVAPGDFNGDGDVDSDDFNAFLACETGPAISYGLGFPPDCGLQPNGYGFLPADFDADEDIDAEDFAVFQRCWSGDGILADPGCSE